MSELGSEPSDTVSELASEPEDTVTELRRLLERRLPGWEWAPVLVGCSGASVWRLGGGLFVKIGAAAAAEADRLSWLLAHGMPVPEVVDHGTRDGISWLVTTAVPGRTAADPWPAAQRPGVVDALADVVRALHALPVAECPFDRRLAVTVEQARHAVAEGRIDLDDLDEENSGLSGPELLARLEATHPPTEDLVVGHGDFCLPNVLLDPETLAVTGLIDTGHAGVADRHNDLAIATRSILGDFNPQFGPAHARRFLRRYGLEYPDPARITFYRLLDEFH